MNELIKNTEDRMRKSIDALEREYKSIRAGRANAAVLDRVNVDYYGVPTPVQQMAAVSVPEARTLLITPWDKSTLKDIEKAILTADLGLNPGNDGDMVRIPIPPLNEATRKDLVKTVKKLAEDNKVAIRNIRRDVIDGLKKLEKDSLISEDALRQYSDETQKLTDKYIAEIDKLAKEKEQSIMSI